MEQLTPDKSDRKSMDNLMSTLLKLQESAKKKSAKETTPKKQARKGPKKASARNKSFEPLNITKSKSEKAALYQRYGVVVPTYEEILADHKKFDKHKELLARFDKLDKTVLDDSFNWNWRTKVEEVEEEMLDCRHLSLRQLDKAFETYKRDLSEILKGKKYSKRHRAFHQYETDTCSINDDLRCSTSVVVFTQEQKDHLLKLMRLEFDPEDRMTTYFFKVLLPELCLWVFMDVHNMSKKRAAAYLERRPIDF